MHHFIELLNRNLSWINTNSVLKVEVLLVEEAETVVEVEPVPEEGVVEEVEEEEMEAEGE